MSKKIKDLESFERPREKLLKYGVDKLSTPELLALIIRTGRQGKSSLELAKEVMLIIDSNLENLNIEKLSSIKGIGKAKACEILAFLELGKRYLLNKKIELILSPKEVWELWGELRKNKKEHFIIFYLDPKNQVIQKEIVSIGTLTESLVHPREVFEKAILTNSFSIIISHNHPSGSLEPSDEDIAVTQRLNEASKILGIHLLDHIIVTKDSFPSFRDLGILS